MQSIGTVAGFWRYPVKSMRGERLHTASFDLSGMAGDRRFAVVSMAAPVGKPLLTSRERTRMLLYAPTLEPTPSVLTPGGERLPLPSPALVSALQADLGAPGATLEIQHSPDKPITDVRALSLISEATLRHLQQELGEAFDSQRLRNNFILKLNGDYAFAEEELAGHQLRFGSGDGAPIVRIHERVPRCRIVTLDPDTAASDPTLLRYLVKHRGGRVAMYATVLHPGSVSEGASVELLP